MKWFVNLSIANKIASLTLFVAIVSVGLALRMGSSSAESNETKQSNNITINGSADIKGDVVGGNKITNNNGIKGSNYVEESQSKSADFFEKTFLPGNDGEFKYKVELNGKLNITKKFKPFRVEMYGNDPSVFSYPRTLNAIKPFYEIEQELFIDWLGGMKPIYDPQTNESGGWFSGYPQLIKITNITDYGEDIVINNTLQSYVKRVGDANRVVSNFSMGGGESYLELEKKIILKEGRSKIKFKDSDFITLRSGETIIVKIPYVARKTGVYLPIIDLTFKLAGSKGRISIEAPEIIVPKIALWSNNLVDVSISTLKDKKNTTFYQGDLNSGESTVLWDESKKQYSPFSFSAEKFTKDDLMFLGKKNLRYYRNEVFALKGAKFNSDELTNYFKNKFSEKYKPIKFASEFDINIFSEIEKQNIALSLEIEGKLQ